MSYVPYRNHFETGHPWPAWDQLYMGAMPFSLGLSYRHDPFDFTGHISQCQDVEVCHEPFIFGVLIAQF